MIKKSDIKLYSPCVAATDELIDKSFGGRETITEKEVLNLDFLLNEYKLWILLRPEVIEPAKLDEIKQRFINLVDKSNKFYFLLEDATIQRLIGILIRCFKPQSDEKTCSTMLEIVKEYID